MTWDAIVVGSGFGGALAAHALVRAGKRVLMLERGGWVERGPENRDDSGAGLVGPHYSRESPYHVRAGRRRFRAGAWHCVGGQSVFYGGASFRFRERDFDADAEIVGDSGAEWPFDYQALEPFYASAERLLGVAGAAGTDPTEPSRSAPFPHRPGPLSRPASAIAEAARASGLAPFRIPLAIAYETEDARRACPGCGTCDGYACAAEAKNDIATSMIPALLREGLTLRTRTTCVQLVRAGSRIAAVDVVDEETGTRERLTARLVVLAAGTLATPHLLLASDLAAVNPAAHAVGRYLMRHRNAVVLGVFPRRPNPERVFDKQIAIHDFYFGHPDIEAPYGKLGGIQQLTPAQGLVRAYMPWPVRRPAAWLTAHCSGLLAIAEDQPHAENGVTIDRRAIDRVGLPRLHVRHSYSRRDERAVAALVAQAKRVLRAAGARVTLVHTIQTFSHAVGTVRMGPDPRTSPLDADGRYRGLDNLYVVDGSALPRSAGVNPSLTIAANALRIGSRIAGERPRAARALALHPSHESRPACPPVRFSR